MSGGVDSSVAAALLLREGYDVVGCFMRLGSPGESLDELLPADAACEPRAVRIGRQGCCSINDAADARLVAAELGIPFYVCNFKKDFGRIIDYFVDEYAAGRTPNPCVRCNDWLKFGKLHDYARQIGADFVASGHYSRVMPASAPGGFQLRRGIDHAKDQSYVLFGVPRSHLPRMLLPIGHFEKPAIRDLARQFGLPVFNKPDSQEICFVPDNDYAALVERIRPEVAGIASGHILDESGTAIGRHDGHHHFTIGQRRGIRLGGRSGGHGGGGEQGTTIGDQAQNGADVGRTRPLYVLSKDPARNTITVGPRERLLAASCTAGEANWLAEEVEMADGQPVLARYRSNGPAVPARVRLMPPEEAVTPSGRQGRFKVRFDTPQSAVASGQAIVLYSQAEPDLVFGGGWIQSVDSHE